MKAARNDLNSKEKKSLKNVVLVPQSNEIPPVFVGMEHKPSEHDKKVIEMLKHAADMWHSSSEDLSKDPERILESVENHYEWIRNELKFTLPYSGSNRCVEEEDEEDNKKTQRLKKTQTASEIREQNTVRRLKEILTYVTKWYTDTCSVQKLPSILRSNFNEPIEIILIRLLIHLRHFLKLLDAETEFDDQWEYMIYEHVFGVSKIIATVTKMQAHNRSLQKLVSVPSHLSQEIEKLHRDLIQESDFDILRAAAFYPKLFIRTEYDHFLPGMTMAPYESQMEVLSSLNLHMTRETPLWLWLNTLTGEGKTTLVIALAKLVMNFNQKSHRKQPIEVLYCCNNRLATVRQQVGQFALSGMIPFGVAESADIVWDHPICAKMDTKRLLTLADEQTTVDLLRKSKNYLLFFDEPTFRLDQPDSVEETQHLTNVMRDLPKWSIFATATAPREEEMPELPLVFPQGTRKFVTSMRVQIGSEIVNFEGKPFLPHLGCTTHEEYCRVVERIKQNGFLQKCYTANVVNRMYVLLSKWLKSVPDFRTVMSEPVSMNQEAVQQLGLTYLEILASHQHGTEKALQSVCDARNYACKDALSMEDLCTKFGRFENQTLVVTHEPIDFFRRYIQPYLQTIVDEHGCSFSELLKQYDREMRLFEAEVEKIYEETDKAGSKQSKLSAADRQKMVQDRLAMLEQKRPRICLKRRFIIGSREYYHKQLDESKECVDKVPTERPFVLLEHVEWEKVVCEDWHQLGLAVGVGILCNSMTASYKSKVMELASKGYLAYVISDENICYGTNYPFESVVVDGDECMKNYSVKSLFQLFARAGRPGKSWRANIFAHDIHIQKIRDDVKQQEYVMDIETQRVNHALHEAIADHIDKIDVLKVPSTSGSSKSNVVGSNGSNECNEILESWEDFE